MLLSKRTTIVRASLLLALALPHPAQAGNLICDFIMSGIDLILNKPGSIQWDVDLREGCKITSQGALPDCTLHSAVMMMTPWLRRIGDLGPSENLNLDFYYAKHLQELIAAQPEREQLGRNFSFLVDHEQSYFGGVENLRRMLNKYGVVKESDYRFPKHRGTTLRSLWRDDWHKQNLTLLEFSNAFLATIDVPSQPLSAPLPNSSYFALNVPGADDVDEMLAEIQKQLDAGDRVVMGWKAPIAAYIPLALFANPGLNLPIKPLKVDQHSMTVVAYAREKGKIEYLLIANSSGTKFGDQGFAVINRRFLKKYAAGIELTKEQIVQ